MWYTGSMQTFVVVVMVSLSTGGQMEEASTFQGERSQNRGHFYVDEAIDVVFPLFGAEAEARWAPGWRPEWVYPSYEEAQAMSPERGWVFKTDGGTPEERIWYVEVYSEAAHEAVYLVLWPNRMVYRIEVKSRSQQGGTFTTVEYDYRGLSAEGNRLIRERTANPNDFTLEMNKWAEQIMSHLRKAESR